MKQSRMDTSGVLPQRNRASVEVSFHVSLRIVKAKKPQTISVEWMLPCATNINRILIGKDVESKLKISSLSDNPVKSKILLMFEDIKDRVIEQMKLARLFAPQLDEFTGVSALHSQW